MSNSYRDPYDGGGGMPQFALPRLTPMVKRLMLVTAIAFGVQVLLYFTPVATGLERFLGLDPAWWRRVYAPLWQLVTYAFLHSVVDPFHILWNMLLLFFFGTMLEAIIGSRRFLVTYVAALLCGGLLHLVAELVLGTSHYAIGASGAVLGVLVAAAVLRPNTQVLVLFIPVKLKWLAIGIVALDAYVQAIALKNPMAADRTAHFVHLGGAAWGFLSARRGWIHADPIALWRARRAEADVVRREEQELEMDSLLEKIHREGLSSLSRREREFLKRMSKRQ